MTAPERVIERLWAYLDTADPDACWLWPKSVGSHGYGQIGWWEDGHSVMVLTHRVAWESRVGPIPDGLTIDHLCRVRRCCNPSHLRLLTNLQNASDNGFATRTHCPQGHEYAGENLYVTPKGYRHCRTCARDRHHRRAA